MVLIIGGLLVSKLAWLCYILSGFPGCSSLKITTTVIIVPVISSSLTVCQASYQALESLHLIEPSQQLCVPKIPVSRVWKVRLKHREVKSVPWAHTAKS